MRGCVGRVMGEKEGGNATWARRKGEDPREGRWGAREHAAAIEMRWRRWGGAGG